MKKILSPAVLFVFMALILGSSLAALADGTVGEAIDDTAITTKVKYELAEDVKFSTLKNVQVKTNKGEVTLTGKVHTVAQKEHAGFVAHKVKGVKSVNNMLSVVPDK